MEKHSTEKLNTWVLQIIKHLHSQNFYGKITFEFKDGSVCLVRKEETIKPTPDQVPKQ